MAEMGIRLMEGFRDDYLPGMRTWDAFALLLIIRKMYEMHTAERKATASALSRAVGMPRTTVLRKLSLRNKIGAVEKYGLHFMLSPKYFNNPAHVAGL
jgi:DNA-binding IclR family transcriptional regulator